MRLLPRLALVLFVAILCAGGAYAQDPAPTPTPAESEKIKELKSAICDMELTTALEEADGTFDLTTTITEGRKWAKGLSDEAKKQATTLSEGIHSGDAAVVKTSSAALKKLNKKHGKETTESLKDSEREIVTNFGFVATKEGPRLGLIRQEFVKPKGTDKKSLLRQSVIQLPDLTGAGEPTPDDIIVLDRALFTEAPEMVLRQHILSKLPAFCTGGPAPNEGSASAETDNDTAPQPTAPPARPNDVPPASQGPGASSGG